MKEALFEYILKQNGVADIGIKEIYDVEAMAGLEYVTSVRKIPHSDMQ